MTHSTLTTSVGVDADTFSYLQRLYLEKAEQTSPLSFLHQLHLHHSLNIPFENLSILLGQTPSLRHEDLVKKIIHQQRGGYCYELNGLFYNILKRLGYTVTLLSARILFGAQGVFARGHKLLLVRLENSTCLADVGYRNGLLYPLEFLLGQVQQQYSETFRLVEEDAIFVLQKQLKGEWRDLYSFTLDPQLPVDFEPHNFYNAYSPDSIFTRMRIVSLKTKSGSVSLLNNFWVEIANGERTETAVTSAADYSRLLQTVFGISLSKEEAVRMYQLR